MSGTISPQNQMANGAVENIPERKYTVKNPFTYELAS